MISYDPLDVASRQLRDAADDVRHAGAQVLAAMAFAEEQLAFLHDGLARGEAGRDHVRAVDQVAAWCEAKGAQLTVLLEDLRAVDDVMSQTGQEPRADQPG